MTRVEGGSFGNCENIELVICKAEVVPSTISCFDGSYVQFAKLLVPASALADYQTTEPWSNFGTIEALPEYLVIDGNGVIVPRGRTSPWHMTYIYQEQDTGTAPGNDANGNAWYDLTFDDTEWNHMTGPVDRSNCPHFGLSDYFDVPDDGCALYLRRAFTIDAAVYQDLPDQIVMKMAVDDYADVYLNGKLVWTNANDGSIDYSFTIDKSKFVAGDNVLAIYYRDVNNPSYLDYQLMTAPKEGYAYFDPATGTLTFVCDNQFETRTGVRVYTLDEPNGEPGWYSDGMNNSVTEVVVDPSFADARPTSLHSWFRQMTLRSITGLEYLNTSEVTTTNAMFYCNISIAELDLSHFDVSKVSEMCYMLYGCTGLTRLTLPAGMSVLSDYENTCDGVGNYGHCELIVPSGFNFGGVDTSGDCFSWVGGYFSMPREVYAEIDGSGAMTLYHDGDRESRTGATYLLDADNGLAGSYARGSVTSITIDETFANLAPSTTAGWFKDMTALTGVSDLENITTWNVGDMSEMFSGCTSLTTLDLTDFDIYSANVATSLMFSGCSSLSEVTVSESMSDLEADAFSGVGTAAAPCLINAPQGFNFDGVSTAGDCFQWKGGYFKLVAEATISLTDVGMGTYCSPRDLDFSGVTDLKTYIVTGYDRAKTTVYAMRVYDVPAGTGLLLIGAKGDYEVPYTNSNSYYINMLVGTLSETWIEPEDGDYTNLRLTGKSRSDASFNKLTQGRTFSANRAYLQIPTDVLNNAAQANTISIVFDDETEGIAQLSMDGGDDAEWFTLDGRKLAGRPTAKGVYVANGRKVVVR